jgi:hypothetical protein
MRPSNTAAELEGRVAALIERLDAAGANLAGRDPKRAVAEGCGALLKRGVIHKVGPRLRVRERSVLRYYARTIQHLLPTPAQPGTVSDRT